MIFLALGLLASVNAELPVVVIDPGHGGEHLGAIGSCGVMEKDVTLAIGLELSKIVRANNRAMPLLTRSSDRTLSLEERTHIANRNNAEFFLSIHANASTNREASGVETYFLSTRTSNKRSREVAQRENNFQVHF